MRRNWMLAAAAGLVWAAGCAVNEQSSDDNGSGTEYSRAEADRSGWTADQAFVRDAAAGGMKEVEMGRAAAAKTSNPDVRAFAQRMVTDHAAAGDDLRIAAARDGIAMPAGMDQVDRADMEEMSRLTGADFDKRYMSMMVRDHQNTVARFENEAENGKAQAVKDFAERTLPTLREHARLAQEIQAKVGG